MVAVTVFTHAGRAVGFLLKGHAGYGEQGEDLACAGISAITQTALLGITDVLKITAKVTLEEGNALCLLSEDTPEGEREKADVVIRTMEAGLRSLLSGYPKALKLSHREV
jgi:uncharacterized protein YsxB (DUF464 family)